MNSYIWTTKRRISSPNLSMVHSLNHFVRPSMLVQFLKPHMWCVLYLYILIYSHWCIAHTTLLAICIACFDKFLFVCYLLWMLLIFLSIFTCFCVKNPKHIKSRKSKKFDQHYCVLSHACFALYLHTNGFAAFTSVTCFYALISLYIYVIIVNRSSNLSWIISQWFCWSWDLYRLVLIYLPTILFFA